MYLFFVSFSSEEGFPTSRSVETVENHGKNGEKYGKTFVKIVKITAKTRRRHGIKSRAQRPLYTVDKTQHPALMTIITCR